MKRLRIAASAVVVLGAMAVGNQASAAEAILRDVAFQTCLEVNAMAPDERQALTLKIARAAADYYQSQIPDTAQTGEQMGWLIRSGCTIAPEGYFSTVVARAVRVMGRGIEPPLRQPLDMTQAVFLTCSGANALPPDQLKQLGTFIGNEAAAHYGFTPAAGWTPDYAAALVYNGCKLYPDAYYLSMVGRAVRAVSGHSGVAAAAQ